MLRTAIPIAASIALASGPAHAAAAASWRWPVAGEVIASYSYGADPFAPGQHRGIDVAAPVASEVRAAVAGTVRHAGPAGSSGLTVSIRTGDGRFDTTYLHLGSIAVARGDRVEAGQPIARVGRTGRPASPTPHLHFGVRVAGDERAYRDPLDLLPTPARPRLGPAPRGAPVPATPPPSRLWDRPVPRAARASGVDLGWAVACSAAMALAALLGRSSIGGSCRTTSPRRSTTSTASPTWATSTRP